MQALEWRKRDILHRWMIQCWLLVPSNITGINLEQWFSVCFLTAKSTILIVSRSTFQHSWKKRCLSGAARYSRTTNGITHTSVNQLTWTKKMALNCKKPGLARSVRGQRYTFCQPSGPTLNLIEWSCSLRVATSQEGSLTNMEHLLLHCVVL